MKTLSFLFLPCLLVSCFFISSCEDSDPPTVLPQEVITTFSLVFSGNGESITFTFQDLDGDGGTAPSITNGTLKANTTYTTSAVILNESESPAENVTAEVLEEAEEHQLFYQPSPGLNINWSYSDQDANDDPLGVQTEFVTGAASTGTLTAILRHEPTKDAANVSDGDITNAGGETDIEVVFDVVIE